jgi:hypothetical protein
MKSENNNFLQTDEVCNITDDEWPLKMFEILSVFK